MNAAQQIHAALGYADPKFPNPRFAYATQERRKAGAGAGQYGKGLRNWANTVAHRKHLKKLSAKAA